MKLLYCRQCHDVFALARESRACRCGATAGRYVDDLNATYAGPNAVPLGFANPSFFDALAQQPAAGWGRPFEAFVVPVVCATFRRDVDMPIDRPGKPTRS